MDILFSRRKHLAFAFLLFHPCLLLFFHNEKSPFFNTYLKSNIPNYLYFLVFATLPTVNDALRYLFGFEAASPFDATDATPLEGSQDLLSKPELYGTRHLLLNLKIDTYWFNMGYWKSTKIFSEACQSLTKRVAEAAQVRAGDKILDVGYGCGDQDLFLYRQYRPEEIIGLTIEPTQARIARDRIAAAGLQDRVKLYLGDAARLSRFIETTGLIPKNHLFDRVLAIDSAYHYHTRASFLEQALAHLRPGGTLALTDIIPSEIPEESSMQGYFLRALCYLGGIPKENLVTPDQYRKMMTSIGFEDVHMEFIEDDVFPGLIDFIDRQNRLCGSALGGNYGWVALNTVRWFLKKMYASKSCHFILLSARKPYGRL